MTYALLRRAILERRSVTAKADDHVRYFSPHILGIDIDGARIVIGYQYGGGKHGGLISGGEWCRFDIRDLQSADLNDDSWRDGPPALRVAVDAGGMAIVAEAAWVRLLYKWQFAT